MDFHFKQNRKMDYINLILLVLNYFLCIFFVKSHFTNLALPLRAAWWIQLNPLLLQIDKSALLSKRSSTMSSLLLDMASCIAVSPSESQRFGWAPHRSNVLTTCKCPLLTAICNALCLRLFLAFKSQLALANISITSHSSPNAAWCIDLSPSLSFRKIEI